MPAIRYLALLRAVNVGGRTVTMERLRALFSDLGFTDVHTYIQTGNVFFTTKVGDRAKVTRTIEAQLSTALGYDVPVFLRSLDELAAIVASPLFSRRPANADERRCVMFTPRPVPVQIGIVTTPQNDFEVLGTTPGEVFLVWRLVNGRPGNPGALIEKAHKVKTTTRFFHTLEKMYAAGIAGAAPVQRSRSR